MSEEQKSAFIEWIIANILLPLVPLGIKISLYLFSNIKVTILDSIELILYSFFICIILTNITIHKKSYGKLLHLLLKIVCGMDMIVMVLVYIGEGNIVCHIYALVMAILVPVFAISYKKKQIKNDKEVE